MVQTSEGRRWLDRAAAGIRSRPDREAVRAELEAHLEDKTADPVRIFPDLGRQEAERQAVEQMGDAEEIGKELAQLHRPWPRYLWQASRVLLTAGLLWLLAIGMFRGDDAYLGDDHRSEWWDMDGLPGTSVMGDCDDIRYLPGGDPDQILTLEPCLTASVNGQKISLLRAALWQRGQAAGAVLLSPGDHLALLGAGPAARGMDDCDRQHRRSLRPGAGFPGGPGNGRTAERDEPNGLRALPQRL